MSTVTTAQVTRPALVRTPSAGTRRLSAFATLAGRRFALSARTPRELFVPLLTPILFAIVIAPALAEIMGGSLSGMDYMTFVAIGTIGLLIPISCMFAGIGVIVDRESGAQRNLLAAPIPRPLIVLGNLAVAVALTTFQIVALLGAALLRGADVHTNASGIAWFVAAAGLFAVGMYGIAETLANRVPKQEEYIGAVPAIAIVPWFFAGSLFPIATLPIGLTWFAKLLPLTHALALMRYGLVDRQAAGLHDIWGMSDPTMMAALSLGVIGVFAAALTLIAVRVFSRAAVR